jgi:hypothetical protein
VRRPSPSPAALLAVLLLVTGCGRCGAPPAGPPAERWVPARVAAVVLVPRLAEAARQGAALHGTLASLPGQYELQALRGALSAQLSFDPFDPASMAGAGLDAERGAAVAELPGPQPGEAGATLLVLPVGDAARLTDLVARLARDRLGAAEQGLENANGKPITVWRRAAGEPAMLAMATVERLAIVSPGPGGAEAVRAALALDPALSLEQSPAWQRARTALGEAGAVLVFTPPSGGPLVFRLGAEGAALALSATARSLRLVLATPLGAQEPGARRLAGPGQGKAGAARLDPATVLVGRVSADPGAALALAGPELGLGRSAEPLRRVAELLEPPIEVGLSLAPRADLAAALGGQLAADPLRVVRLEAVAALKAGAAPAALFDELARAGGGGGQGGRWHVPAALGEVAWTVAGQRLLVAAGPAGSLDALVARGADEGWRPPTPAGGQALTGGLGGLVFDGAALTRALQALPPEAYGTGPDAVVARSLVEKATLPGGQALTASLRADLPAGALRLVVEVSLGGPEKSP